MSTRPRWRPTRGEAVVGAPHGTRATAVTLPCVHFEETIRFYSVVFAVPQVVRSAERVVLDFGTLELVLIDASGKDGYTRGDGQGVYLELSVPAIPPVHARLEEMGARTFRNSRMQDRLLTVQDPEGNLVNILAAEPRDG